MKKILSVLLCLAMLCTSVCIALPASAQVSDYNRITEAPADVVGATAFYESYYGAALVTPNTVGETASLTLPGVGGGDIYAVVMLPASYGVESAEIISNASVNLPATRKFIAVNLGAGESASVSFTLSGKAGIYFYGTASAERAEEMVAQANGSLNEYSEEYLNLDTYDIERYTEYYWDTELVFNESFFPLKNKDGSLSPINLAYDVDKVVSVRNATLDKEYVYGVDYVIENGDIVLLESGNISLVDYETVYRDTKINTSFREALDGTYAFCGQQNLYFTGYYNITYTTKDTWDGAIPESKSFLLPNTTEKLTTAGSNLKVLCIGDSLGGGANASADIGVAPFADGWSEMFPKALAVKYPETNVEYKVIAQGGADASLCIEKIDEIIAYAPDLFVIEFGTNDCMNGDNPYEDGKYISILRSAIDTVKESLPNCDIIVTSPIITNPIFFPSDWFYRFGDSVYTLEEVGVATTDMVNPSQYLLTEKRYLDMSGDFLCHPSDYGMRMFTQCLLKTVEPQGTEQDYINGLAERITYYRYANEFHEEQWNEITSLAADAAQAIGACTTAEEAVDEYLRQAAIIDAVPTIQDIINSSTIDCSNIIFNTSKTTDLITKTTNCATKFDEEKSALTITTTGRSANVLFDLTKGDTTVLASDYTHVVITMKNPATNNAKAVKSKINFKANGAALTAITYNVEINDNYVSYIVDLSGVSGWTGTVTEITLYPIVTYTTGDYVDVHSIVFATDVANATDIAIERERAANGLTDSVVTKVITNDADAALLKTQEGESYIMGDANADGILNAKDCLFTKRYLSDNTQSINEVFADMDLDGAVTPADALLVTKTLAGVIEMVTHSDKGANIAYDLTEKAAKVDILKANATLTYDLAADALTADTFKYVSLCAKTGDGSATKVGVVLTTDAGEFTGELDIAADSQFTADTAAITNATGNIISVTFTFDVSVGETVYFDSFVLTPTMSTARNAETVRVGAANLS